MNSRRSDTVNLVNNSTPSDTSNSAVYTCPMHPEIRQDKPGICPKCGMTLEKIAGPSSHWHKSHHADW